MIAVVGIGVGLALGRSELERRFSRARDINDQEPAVDAGDLAHELRNVALGYLQAAIERLRNPDGDHGRAIYDTRKAIKRTRALLRLLRGSLGEREFRAANRALRRCNRKLAGARDADVALATLRSVIAQDPKRLEGKKAVRRLQSRLLKARGETRSERIFTHKGRESVIDQLLAVSARLKRTPLEEDGSELVRRELTHTYRSGRVAMRAAQRSSAGDLLHEWRKRVKDLRYAAEALGPLADAQDSSTRQIGRVARKANRLGELLGDEHDLALLSGLLDEHARLFEGDKRTSKRLRKLIARRRMLLRLEALVLGARLYEAKPRAFVKNLGLSTKRRT